MAPDSEDMTGRTVLVTGAADGLGRALARALVAALSAVTGRYFDGTREAAADPQAYDGDARARLSDLKRPDRLRPLLSRQLGRHQTVPRRS